ncbi:MAG TPA: TRAP transporter substrate-binding protein DctP [Vicinamibacterales bacterium]|nr:TRAP transporter substrate-binding protein DctP [Vicinamibacterales bacterium]
MSPLKKLSLVSGLAVALVATPAAQEPLNIKLATQVPTNSSWHKALTDMGAEWTAKTGGRVKLTVYPGGTQGDEESTIRLMRPGVDQLQANLLTIGGLAHIDKAFNVFGMPFFFENDAEMQYVLTKLSPTLTPRLEAKGFKVLSWGSGGWVQLFSKEPISTLDGVKKAKLFTAKGDEEMVQWYRTNGFNPVALTINDIPAQLRIPNGMINAAPMPPYGAMVLQIFKDAKYVMDVRVAPLVGALVVSNAAWNKISAADQAVMIASARAFETTVNAKAPEQDADSIKLMKTRGLTVTSLDAKGLADFRTAVEKMSASMKGTIVPADVYDMALRDRDAYRKTRK